MTSLYSVLATAVVRTRLSTWLGSPVAGVQNRFGQQLQLLHTPQVCGAVAVDKVGINLPGLLLRQRNGKHLLNAGEAHRALQAADDDQMRQVNPAVSFFHRRGDQLQPHVVVHGAGSQNGVLGAEWGCKFT